MQDSLVRVAALAFVAAVVLAGCSGTPSESFSAGDTTHESAAGSAVDEGPNATTSASVSPAPPGPVVVTAENLDEALAAAGIACSGGADDRKCEVSGSEMSIGAPKDWARDTRLRKKACDDGYINLAYKVVGDNATWYATADYDEVNQALIDALAAAGYSTSIVAYCPD